MDETYHINVFRDNKGGIHYSTEEFSVYDSAIYTYAEAVEDAYKLSVRGGWRYLCTLRYDGQISRAIVNELSCLEQARFTVEEYGRGRPAGNYSANELINKAADLIDYSVSK